MFASTPPSPAEVLQIVTTQDGAVHTTSATFPDDDTIPQNTEGYEFITQAITPVKSDSTLIIDVEIGHISNNSANPRGLCAALFKDAQADSLAIAMHNKDGAGLTGCNLKMRHVMASPGTGTYTFKVRVGATNTGTTTINGYSGVRKFGGVYASRITITELRP